MKRRYLDLADLRAEIARLTALVAEQAREIERQRGEYAALTLAHARVREALDKMAESDWQENDPDGGGCEVPKMRHGDMWLLARETSATPAPDGAKVLAVVRAAMDAGGWDFQADQSNIDNWTRLWRALDALVKATVALRADPAWKGVG